MPVSRSSPTPVFVEMEPSNAYSPASSSTASPKSVRFATTASGLVRSARPPTHTEEWSAWNFEHHASRCRHCADAFASRLCGDGRLLASDLALNLEHHPSGGDAAVYSIRRDASRQPERVELHPDYVRVRALLRSLALPDHHRRHRPSPTHTGPARSYDPDMLAMYARPVRTPSPVRPSPQHYYTARPVVPSKFALSQPASPDHRKGSLFVGESSRPQSDKGYRVVERSPSERIARDDALWSSGLRGRLA